MIHHVVLLKFKPEVSESDISDLEKCLEDLPNKIMEIKVYEFGRDMVHASESYDFALVALFANLQALDRYRKHSDHLPVVAKIKTMCSSVVTVDFRSSDASSTSAGPPEWERSPFERLKF
jgi:Stress responsive A/B Barrel Domain